MENSTSEHILCSNIDILLKVMSMLDAEDQLALARVHDSIGKAFLEYIWKRKLKLDTNIIEFDKNFKSLNDKNCQKIRTLRLKGGIIEFKLNHLKPFVNLTEICLNGVHLNVNDVYSIPRIARNLEIFKLENMFYYYTSQPVVRSIVKSLKKLHLTYSHGLQPFIEDCLNLEELIIKGESVEDFQHSLLSADIIKSNLDDIRKDYAKVSEYITTNDIIFEIIAKIDCETIVNIFEINLDLHSNCENIIEHFNLMHLKNLKLRLYIHDEHYLSLGFMNLIFQECKQLQKLVLCAERPLIGGLNINMLVSLRQIIIIMPMSAENLFHILKDLNLYFCELNWNLFHNEESSGQNQTYGKSVKVLKCNGFDSPEKNMEMFFQLYPNGFQNLNELYLYNFQSIELMLEIALKYFGKIKYLSIIFGGEINEKILETLIKFPLLKYLRIQEFDSRLDPDDIAYLRKHIDKVIMCDWHDAELSCGF